jgi:hypothetical protein
MGKFVVLQNIKSESYEHFNGARGKVISEQNDGRWGVQLVDKTMAHLKPISCGPVNLQVLVSSDDDDDVRGGRSGGSSVDINVVVNLVRQNPMYTLAALKPGVYVIGMKDQFNVHDLPAHPLCNQVQYVADEMGFVLFDKTNTRGGGGDGGGAAAAGGTGAASGGDGGGSASSLDSFGPYFIEQYVLMEMLSKQEVAQNVLDYYAEHKGKLERGLEKYDETQGKGFICWRFVMRGS